MLSAKKPKVTAKNIIKNSKKYSLRCFSCDGYWGNEMFPYLFELDLVNPIAF
jgi:hypothetical protein